MSLRIPIYSDGSSAVNRLGGMEHAFFQLSDGTPIWLANSDTDGSGFQQMRLSNDRATTIAGPRVTPFQTNAGTYSNSAAMCRDNLDNLYALGWRASDNVDYVVITFAKGTGHTWAAGTYSNTISFAAGQAAGGLDIKWVNTGGGTGGKGHIICTVSRATVVAYVFDAGALLAGSAASPVSSITLFGGTGVGFTTLATDGFGGASGMVAGQSGSTIAIDSWSVNSSGIVSNTSLTAPTNVGATTPRRIALVRYSSNAFALVYGDSSAPTQYRCARYSTSARLTDGVISGTPTNMPLVANTNGSLGGGGGSTALWAVQNDPSAANRIRVFAQDALGAVWSVTADLGSGVTWGTTAVAETNSEAATQTQRDGIRMVENPEYCSTPSFGDWQIETGNAGNTNYVTDGDWHSYPIAPLAPTLTAPVNASYQDVTSPVTFQWVYNPGATSGAQNAWALREKISGAGSYLFWNAGTSAWQSSIVWNTGAATSVTISTGLTNGNVYNWSVATQENVSNLQGPFAADNTFTASLGPTVTVTGPTGTVVTVAANATWTEVLQGGALQTSYRVVVETGTYGTTPGSGTQIYDSGVISSASLFATMPGLQNSKTHRVFVQITETGGQPSAWGFSTFSVLFDAPATPSIIPVWDSTNARAAIAVQGRDNLLTANQSSLETNTTGWFAFSNCTIARSTAQFLDGSASLALTSSAAGDMWAGTATDVNGVAVKGAAVYTAVASFRAAATPRGTRVVILWYDAAGTYLGPSTGANFADNTVGWTQATVTAQAPVNAATAAVEIYALATGGAAEVHYVDQVGIFPNPTGNLLGGFDDFENGITGWSNGTNWTIAQSASQAYTGRSAMLATRANGTAGNGYVFSPSVGCVAGKTYTASVWLRPSGSTSYSLALAGVGSGARATTNAALTANIWQRVTVTYTTAANDTGLQILVTDDPNGAPTNASTLYIDAVKLEVGAVATTYVPSTYSNLVTNPSFEVDTSGWSPVSVTAAATTAWAAVGTKSLALTSTGTTDCYAAFNISPTAATITVSATAYLPAPMSGTLDGRARSIQCYTFDATGTLISGYNSAALANTAGATGRLSVIVTVPTGGRVEIRLYNGSPTTGDVIRWDAVQAEAGNVANPYIDGSQGPGYSWDASQNLLSAAAASFEDGTTGGWVLYGASTISNSTLHPFDGTKCLQLVTTGTFAGAIHTLPVTTGATITCSVYIYGPADTYFVVVGDGSGNNAVQTSVAVPANTLTRVVFTTTITAAMLTSGGPALLVKKSTAGTFFIDAIQVEQRAYATPYGQTATANAATSTFQQPWTLGGFAASGLYTIEASENNGVTWKAIRGSGTFVVDSAANQQFTAYDYERTPGASVLYRTRVTDLLGAQTTTSLNSPVAGPITATMTSWWVKDVLAPALNISICDAQQHVRNRKGDSSAVYPAGRSNPVVLRGPVHGNDGQMRCVVSTEADRTAALNAFSAVASMLLQDPRGRQWYVEWVGDLTESQMPTDSTHPIYAIQRNWVEVDVPS